MSERYDSLSVYIFDVWDAIELVSKIMLPGGMCPYKNGYRTSVYEVSDYLHNLTRGSDGTSYNVVKGNLFDVLELCQDRMKTHRHKALTENDDYSQGAADAYSTIHYLLRDNL
jgi:hypothetical protein